MRVTLLVIVYQTNKLQYINAEASGGGFPGWLQRIKGVLRTADADYLKATDNYIANIGSAIAKAQITNGGPVVGIFLSLDGVRSADRV